MKDKTNNVIDLYKDILRAVEDLSTCSYTTEAFSELLSRIQAAVRLHANLTASIPINLHTQKIDRQTQSGRVRQPRPVGSRTGQENRRDPLAAPDAHHPGLVSRV